MIVPLVPALPEITVQFVASVERSTRKPLIVPPPVTVVAAFQTSVTCPSPAAAVSDCGAPATTPGTELTTAPAPTPAAVIAETRTQYGVPLVSPLSEYVVAVLPVEAVSTVKLVVSEATHAAALVVHNSIR